MFRLYTLLYLMLPTLGLIFISCEWTDEDSLFPNTNTDCDTAEMSYRENIKPIISEHCAACHGPNSAPPLNTMALLSLDDVKIIAEDGSFLDAVSWNEGVEPMPYAYKLDDCEIMKIQAWIEQGMFEGCDTLDLSYINDIKPILREHCLLCHSEQAAPNMNTVNLEDFNNLKFWIETDTLLGSMEWDTAYSPMPYTYRVSSCDLDMIKAWINQGMTNDEPICDTADVSYAEDIVPLFAQHCYSCHNEEIAEKIGTYPFEKHEEVRWIVKDGSLIGSITKAKNFSPMPYEYDLTSCEIELIEAWIRQGEKDN